MPTPYNEYLTPEEKANDNNLYDFKITGDIDKLTLKGGDPLKAYLGETPLTAKDMGDYYAYSDGNGHQWSYPKSKLEDTSNLNAYQRLEDGWRKSSAYGFDKMMLGTLGLGISPFVAMEAAPYLATLANGSADAAMATRAGQLANRVLTSPYGKAGLSSIFGGMGMHNFFSDNGYAKTFQEWNNLKNDPSFYNAVNFGKSAAGDVMDVTMMAPLYKPLTYAGKEAWNVGKQGMTFINSPITGNWATFGNRQYRFKPGHLGMNGTPIESRPNINPSGIKAYRGSRRQGSISSDSYSSDFFTNSKEAASGYGDYVTEVEFPSDARIIEVDANGNRWDLLGGRQYRQEGDLEAFEAAKKQYSDYKASLMKKYNVEPTEENSEFIDSMLYYGDLDIMADYAEKMGMDPDLFRYYDPKVSFDFGMIGMPMYNKYLAAKESIKEVPVDGLLEVPGLGKFTNIDDIGRALAENQDYPYSVVAVNNVSDAADIGASGFGTHTQYVVRKNLPRTQTGSWKYGAPQSNNIHAYGGPLVAQANMFGDGGSSNDYNSWKQQIRDYKGIIVDGDNTYDYKRFYDENPDIAWGMLRDGPNAHFIDRYKTPYHPTYSDESLYSRSPFVQGGHWEELLYPTVSGQKWNYQLSPSQVVSNWDVARTLDYAADAEDDGFYVTDSQGRYPIFDGIVQGGVLPSVEVSNYEDGGSLNTYKQWQDLPIKERADIMKVAIRNGITNLADIKAKYNEFAMGKQLEESNLYGGGGTKNLLSGAYQKLSRINQLQAAGMTPQEAHAMQYYVDRGFAPHQAAGFVGGFVRESALDPTALNKNSGAYGIGQWLGPRKDALMKMYGNNPTFANELDYSMYELDNTTKEAKRRILSSSTPEVAAANAFNYYGAALDGNGIANMNRWGQDGQKSLQQGIDNAKRLYNLYSSVGFSDGGNMYSKGSWLRKKTAAISKASKVPTISKKSTPMSNSSAYAMQYFINKGLAPHQAAGLVGNLMRESGLNPLAINPGSKAYGLAQWLGARKKKLFSMYGSKPTLQNQLDFVWWELNNTHKNGLKHLMAARNAEEAARAGMNWFEFSNGDAISEMNKWGQDGKGSMRRGIMYATKLAGQPMPDLSYLDAPNPTMQQPQTYGQMPMGYGYPIQQPQNDNDTLLAFEPSNPQAFFAPLSSYETSVEQPVTQPLVDVAEQQYKAERAERQRVMQQNNNMLALVSYLNGSGGQDSSPFGVFNMLSGLGNQSSYGGNLNTHNKKNLFVLGGEEESSVPDALEAFKHGMPGSIYNAESNFYPAIGGNMRTPEGETGVIQGIDETGRYQVQFPNEETPTALTLQKELPEVTITGKSRNTPPFLPEEQEEITTDFLNSPHLTFDKDTYGMSMTQPELVVSGKAPRYKELDEENLETNEYLERMYDKQLEEEMKASSPEDIKEFQKKFAEAGGYTLDVDSMSSDEIKALQRKIGTKDDGIWGPESRKKWIEYNVDGRWGKRTQEAWDRYKTSFTNGNWDNYVPTENTEWCAAWVHKKVEDATGSNYGVRGNAWNMPMNVVNAGGSQIYNLYDDSFKDIKNVSTLKKRTEEALKKHPFDVHNLQVGDVVGIYMPSSNMHEEALATGTTFNTHVGVVTGIDKDGTPIIEHNIHRKHHRDKANRLTGSAYGKPMITVAVRPGYVRNSHIPFATEMKDSPYTSKGDSPLFVSYANSVAGSKEQISKLFPNVDMDEVERITLAVQGRETGFMKSRKSDLTGISAVKSSVADFYRDKIKHKNAEDISSNLSKMKMSAFSAYERKMLGIKSIKDLEDPQVAGRAATYLMAKNYSYFKNLQTTYPNLGITDDDIRYLTELSYNQGMSKLRNIGFDEQGLAAPDELKSIRDMSKSDAKIKDVTSTNYRHLGKVGEVLYDTFGSAHTPYISAAEQYREKLIKTKERNQRPTTRDLVHNLLTSSKNHRK